MRLKLRPEDGEDEVEVEGGHQPKRPALKGKTRRSRQYSQAFLSAKQEPEPGGLFVHLAAGSFIVRGVFIVSVKIPASI
jgi:hypothetical protein